jgi:hypothetical protein
LSLLNVRYILSVEPLSPPLSLVYDKEVKIYRNPDAFPRAFLVHQVETVKDGSMALERVMNQGPDLKQAAVVEGSLPTAFIESLPQEKNHEDQVQIIKYTAQKIVIQVETSSPGLLVLSDAYFPGWRASVNGNRVPIHRADYFLRAVAVDGGKDRVVFRYQPLSFRIGLGLTLISGLIILWCFKRGRK